MSFSFGFTQDSFSDDELIDAEISSNVVQTQEIDEFKNPLDQSNPEVKSPVEEDLKKLLTSLIDVRITFERCITPGGQMVYRRELFDVKHQLMREEGGTNQDEEFNVLMGTDTTDLQKNVYEGGLKSWECSIDTVDKLSIMTTDQLFNTDVAELGCGTALPSTYLFQKAIVSKAQGLNFKLSDYNPAVLRLVTLPNMIISWALSALFHEQLVSLQRSEDEDVPIVDDELQLSKGLLKSFVESLSSQNIKIQLFSGAWNREFYNLITKDNRQLGLIITSETIYSPETLPIVGELLIELLSFSKKLGSSSSTALVAAKNIYFGVGGSLVDFESYLSQRIQQGAEIQFQTEKVNAGLQRSIVIIR